MILLNFVIALISQSYDSVMTKYEEITYMQRTYLNRECRLVLKSFKIKERMDILLLSANSESSLAKEDDWQGFV